MPAEVFSPQILRAALAELPGTSRYRVAFSGGPDSHALLHAMASLRGVLDVPLAAAHVHHGLHAQARQWEVHCGRVCRDLDIDLVVLHVDARPTAGESPEATARRARYEALGERLGAGEILLTAHHRDDQAETVLLQLLRGAGPPGLAGMPVLSPLGRGWLARPLLGTSRAALRAYGQREGLDPVWDPSNIDQRYSRNFLRERVMETLRGRWPGVTRTLARAGAQQAEAARLLHDLAAVDLGAARGSHPGTLLCSALRALPEARRRNALRAWLRERGLAPPTTAQMQHVMEDVLGARSDAQPVARWPGVEIRRYRDRLYASSPLSAHDPAIVLTWDLSTPLALPGGGALEGEDANGRGLSVAASAPPAVEVRFRQGGERCRPAGRGHTHALKKLLQEAAVPPWQRDRLPLVYVGGRLAAVGDLWVCESFRAGPGEPGKILHWRRP
ncbi:MAG: tRNA lysidine(34) synthetase TilS [Gammaproteobacteria bacterium]|nr:tRNA lysidine(34) synthetase TilS [Gammaproteobacteria bacterium]NIR84170.1 tRNA lysidine(34) synthetase TilS [Gammaproteobacteria bacterium]NIR89482.1 tRNA lysidine(34) synthetase TilS [Gammaproteobacteria bacterium]NIU05325.1 tRNA lysidine(34) synthetase TilS [Gammaproteobacteria bacterium]NIV52265.1 tRNA lysidine(34) synthetase TilS [Gammaproteobacteria bacterium]